MISPLFKELVQGERKRDIVRPWERPQDDKPTAYRATVRAEGTTYKPTAKLLESYREERERERREQLEREQEELMLFVRLIQKKRSHDDMP